MKFDAVLTESVAQLAINHLLAHISVGEAQEDLCFATWRPSTGASRTTAIVAEVLLPRNGERALHGNVSFDASYLARATREACRTNSGLAFMHSHPSVGWQAMSPDDVIAERDRIAPPSRATGLPLLGLTVGQDGVWSARFWKWDGGQFNRVWCDKVRVVGRNLNLSLYHSNHSSVPRSRRLRRTVDTWGKEQQTLLSSLKVGVVGLGSVGCIVAEALARIGITDLLLVDADRVEEQNLDRLLYASGNDIGRFKVDLAKEHLKRSATALQFRVEARRAWVQEQDAYQAVLDCDVIFAAVDRPLPKDLLNNIAYVHCIPVVFGGIRVATKPHGSIADATWSVVRASPSSRCLRCDGQYTTSGVMMERDGSLDDPNYVVGSPNVGEISGNENVFPFSVNLASLMVLEMLRSVLRETWWPLAPTKLHYSYVASRMTQQTDVCLPDCSICARTAHGDEWQYPFLDERRYRKTSGLSRLFSVARRLFHLLGLLRRKSR